MDANRHLSAVIETQPRAEDPDLVKVRDKLFGDVLLMGTLIPLLVECIVELL